MIQRIQTIWLLLSVVVLLGLFIFPYVNYIDLVGLGRKIYVTGIFSSANNEVVKQESFLLQMIASVMLILIPILIIFRFKNRKQQIQLIYLQIIFVTLFAIWMYITASTALATNNQFLSASNIGIGFFLLPISIILLVMAIINIRKDEQLLKSADRLR